MLRLQTQARILHILNAILPDETTVEKIARIKLNARLRGQDLEYTTRHRFVKSSSESVTALQDEVVIVAADCTDLRTDCSPVAEVHGCIGDVFDLSRRNQIFTHRSESIC